eukprot:jgi/Mesvir1/15658/Mv03262-RA.1
MAAVLPVARAMPAIAVHGLGVSGMRSSRLPIPGSRKAVVLPARDVYMPSPTFQLSQRLSQGRKFCTRASAVPSTPGQNESKYFMLLYDYVDGMLEKRTPHRPGHVALAKEYAARDQLLLAGAWAEKVDGGAFVFKVPSKADVQAFVDHDPYVKNGLVTKSRIEEWMVVVGSRM